MRSIPCQLTHKMSYNRSRIIKYGFFQRNTNGELELERNGIRYILNNNSLAQKDRNGDKIREGLFRFYFSKKFSHSKVVYVDGYLISEEYTNFDLDEYVNSKENFIRIVNKSIKKFVTVEGREYIGMVQNKGNMVIAFKLGKEYFHIQLRDSEIQKFVKIEDYD